MRGDLIIEVTTDVYQRLHNGETRLVGRYGSESHAQRVVDYIKTHHDGSDAWYSTHIHEEEF